MRNLRTDMKNINTSSFLITRGFSEPRENIMYMTYMPHIVPLNIHSTNCIHDNHKQHS